MPPATFEGNRLARCALEALRTEWPHKLDHLMLGEDDRPLPSEVHPVFFGCYDWHSSVHMHWALLRLRPAVDSEVRGEIDAHFQSRFTAPSVSRERAYAAHPSRGAFERPYGWAWLLKLQAELEAQGLPWASTLAPFSAEVAARLTAYLLRSPYPIRAGMHANSAFAMILAADYAMATGDGVLLRTIDSRARDWFGEDADYPAGYEPGAADFLSGGLCEAVLMSRVLGDAFEPWWSGFDRGGGALRHWLEPIAVHDASDPQGVHLAGLNLSRAWCLRLLASRVARDQRSLLQAAAERHAEAGMRFVTQGEFVATHWLASFAMLCEEALSRSSRTSAS